MDIDLEIFSPVQTIRDELFEKKGIEVFIKRDDLIHPIISGNKWRKLKYILEKARVEQKTHLVTFGGAYSNHLMATAAAAANWCDGTMRRASPMNSSPCSRSSGNRCC